MLDTEVPKYRKRCSKHSPAKSSHKHLYEDCLLLDQNNHVFKASYCTICGRINNIHFAEVSKEADGNYKVLTDIEVLEKYSGLKQFHITSYSQKYVKVE